MRAAAKFISIILIFCLFSGISHGEDNLTRPFNDVPDTHWAYRSILELRARNITDGIGDNRFGLGLMINRSEFVAFLVKLMQWELIYPELGSFEDNRNGLAWYYPFIETAAARNVILKDSKLFRPFDPITREEMAIMIVRSLGYDSLAVQLSDRQSPFEDVFENTGYMILARDFGIITGVGNNLFKPEAYAKREEAATMMIRMATRLQSPLRELHAFYAIRSFNQLEMIPHLDSVGFGWSRLEYDLKTGQVILNTTPQNNNEYAVPSGYDRPLHIASENGVHTQLMVFVKEEAVFCENTQTYLPLVEHIVLNAEIRRQVIEAIITAVSNMPVRDATISFDGVVIDFENLRGEALKQALNLFLIEIREQLEPGYSLSVCVHPARRPGQAYFDAYDFRFIGEIADKVILMAHDYYAKELTEQDMKNGYTVTPLTPIVEIYDALKAITDKDTGVQEIEKVLLQFSFDSVQWKLKEGEIINRKPFQPAYETIRQRLLQEDVVIHYSSLNQNPYAIYYDPLDETRNVLWYEDARSIQAKIDLAKMFGVQGLSLWRLGNIPDYEDAGEKETHLNVWQTILNHRDGSFD